MHCWRNNICDGEGKHCKDISVLNTGTRILVYIQPSPRHTLSFVQQIYLVNKVILVVIFKVFGRHVASDRMVSGAYKSEYGDSEEITLCLEEAEVSLFP